MSPQEIHLENLNRLPCHDLIEDRLRRYLSSLAPLLGENLLGVYLHGSLAHGCFNPATSDVDIVFVVTEPCPEKMMIPILDAHRAAELMLDATFVTTDQLRVTQALLPVLFLVKENRRIVPMSAGSRDFLAYRQDIHERGIALAGPDPRILFDPVPWALLEEYFAFLAPHVRPFFKNPVLMLCRILYAKQRHALCSKREAGEWALGALRPEWRPLVAKALRQYIGPASETREMSNEEDLTRFEEYCISLITEPRDSDK